MFSFHLKRKFLKDDTAFHSNFVVIFLIQELILKNLCL